MRRSLLGVVLLSLVALPVIVVRAQGPTIPMAFIANGHVQILDLAGDGPATQLTSGDFDDSNPAVGPDGRIVFGRTASDGSGTADGLHLVDPSAPAEPTPLTSGPDFQPAWSPDGGLVAFTRFTDDGQQVRVLDLAAGSETALADGVTEPVFTPDGSAVYVLDVDQERTGERFRIVRVELSTGAQTIVHVDDDGIANPVVGPSGAIGYGCFDGVCQVDPATGETELLVRRTGFAGGFLQDEDPVEDTGLALIPGGYTAQRDVVYERLSAQARECIWIVDGQRRVLDPGTGECLQPGLRGATSAGEPTPQPTSSPVTLVGDLTTQAVEVSGQARGVIRGCPAGELVTIWALADDNSTVLGTAMPDADGTTRFEVMAPSAQGSYILFAECASTRGRAEPFAVLVVGEAGQAPHPVPAADPQLGARLLADLVFEPAEGAQFAQSDAPALPIATHVVLARQDEFADALAGAPLADSGPLLYTASDTVPAETRAQIDRLLGPGGLVYLLGGTSAIQPAVEEQLRAAGYDVRRLAGPSRIETALAVADEVRTRHPGVGQVMVARAFGVEGNPTAAWADSVTGGVYGAAAGVPVLVTGTDELHPAVADWLTADPPTETVLLGGTAALSEAVAAAVPNPRRVAGPDRAGTAAAIATQLWGVTRDELPQFLLINGFREDGWGFGLAGAPLAALLHAPLLIVGDTVPPSTAEQVAVCGTSEVDVLLLGDESVITAAVADELARLDGQAC